MRYLKLFKESNNEYYFDIKSQSGLDLIGSISVSMSQKSQMAISNLNWNCKDVKKKKLEGNPKSSFYVQSAIGIGHIFLDITLIPTFINLEIVEIEDEWFIVRIHNQGNKYSKPLQTYKCDQLDGLIQLLKDKELI